METPISVLLLFVFAVALGDKCQECMCKLESRGCTPIDCVMDEGSLSCGYFQIKLDYYLDCGEPGKQGGESTEDAWKRCAGDMNCSVQCINNYMNRYSSLCPEKSGCERIARIHNRGPYGCSDSRSDWYWNNINQCLGQ